MGLGFFLVISLNFLSYSHTEQRPHVFLNPDFGIDGKDVDEWACAGNMLGLFSNNPTQLLKIPTYRKINNNHNMCDWRDN